MWEDTIVVFTDIYAYLSIKYLVFMQNHLHQFLINFGELTRRVEGEAAALLDLEILIRLITKQIRLL